MHFEVLVEDQSGGIAIDIALAKILGPNGTDHSWRTHEYKGLGHIPKDLDATADGCATDFLVVPAQGGRQTAWGWGRLT